MDDIFCRIVRKEIPAHVIYETAETLSFLDVTPSAPGHAMVILKKHGNNILEYTPDDLKQAMATVQIVAQKIEAAIKPDSITIGINHKEKRGVPHLHIHLIPRWENDHGHALQGVVKHAPTEDLSEIAEKIRTAPVA